MRILLRVLTVAMVILLNMLKKELANPKLSWFEENVIRKNTKEREEFTKKILALIQLLTN